MEKEQCGGGGKADQVVYIYTFEGPYPIAGFSQFTPIHTNSFFEYHEFDKLVVNSAALMFIVIPLAE